MEKILTVVVPSYNVEKYLDKTLESLVDSAILEDIEVLVVDDGSKDRTAEIGREYELRYPDSFKVISKENGGHGSTINKGIEAATGKYFKVIDGDDWVQTNDFVKLIGALKNCGADYVVTNYYEVNDITGELTDKSFRDLKREGAWNFEEISHSSQIPMHALVIRTAILQENHIRLDENRFYVDVEYILFPVPFVKTVAYFDLYVYMYRLAVATQSVSLQGYRKHMQNHIDVILHLADFLNSYTKDQGSPEKIKYIAHRTAQMIGDQITIFMSFPVTDQSIKKKFLQFDQDIRKRNEMLYQLSGEYSGMLRLLRKMNFRGYKEIIKLSRIRNGMEKE